MDIPDETNGCIQLEYSPMQNNIAQLGFLKNPVWPQFSSSLYQVYDNSQKIYMKVVW